MCQIKTTRYQLVETQIPAGFTGNKLKILDQPDLRNSSTQIVLTQCIETFFVTTMPLSPSGNTVINAADMAKLSLVLYINGEESVYQIPLPRLNFMQAAASLNVFQPMIFNNLEVEWSKSYFTVVGAALTPGQSVMLGVHYLKGLKGDLQPTDTQTFN